MFHTLVFCYSSHEKDLKFEMNLSFRRECAEAPRGARYGSVLKYLVASGTRVGWSTWRCQVQEWAEVPGDIREPLCCETGPLERMGHHQVVEERCVFLPYLVLFIDHPLLNCIIKSSCNTNNGKVSKPHVNYQTFNSATHTHLNTPSISLHQLFRDSLKAWWIEFLKTA